ncbi:Peptidoglycan/LPS O-acetylase OafA/YrhL, contains acyltransferase and SGNH-hydrolase domains [Prauserella flava]|nr:Peptidoglycan/LPS O-acetylase OafA/YrhL, contains acyltransferase and SGNH-hydrolase domains [Prauserella flava]MCR3733977.1 Peptidoglycan/LPS O-acetylase OafA/YrhL, contains acyltransferase and SGNH-hydrolase domains [Prauserella salsuginis]
MACHGRIGRYAGGRSEGVSALDKTSRSRPKPLEGDDKTRISFVDMGRAIAALLVVYSHIAHPWVQVKGENAPVIGFVETFSSEPMRMATQGIGQIAVPFFFLVSGFIVTPIAIRQGYRKFALNRFIRVYAPLLFVLLLTSAALWAGLEPQSTGQSQELTPWTMFTNWTLVNYILYPQVVLMPVAWTMIIEVLFYLILLALLPVLRRAVWLAIGIELTFVFVVLSSRSELNESWSLFAVNVSYLPILIIGQIVWATTSKKIPLWAGGVFGALAWMLYVYADIIDVGRIDDSYNLAMSIAVMFFLMGYFAEPKLRQFRFWTAMSERSYSIYLLHGLGIFVTLGLLRPTVPFAIALPISLLVTAALVEISYRGVERPSHELARSLSRRVGNTVKRGAGTGSADAPGGGSGADGSRGAGTGEPGGDADHVAADHEASAGESTVRIPADPEAAPPPGTVRPGAVPPGAVPPEAGPSTAGASEPGPSTTRPPEANGFDATRSEPLRPTRSAPLPADPAGSQPVRSTPRRGESPRSKPPRSESPRAEPLPPPRPEAAPRRPDHPRPEPPRSESSRSEPLRSEPRRSEPLPPRNRPRRPAPEPRPERGGGVAEPLLNGHGDQPNRPGDRPRPHPDRAEPARNHSAESVPDRQGEPPRGRPAQPPPRPYRQPREGRPPQAGVDPRREPSQTSNPAEPGPGERPDRQRRSARPGTEHPDPEQPRRQRRRPVEQTPQRSSEQRSPGQHSPGQPPPEQWPQERQPRRSGGEDGPRHAR